MSLRTSLASRAANADLAIRSVLNGEFDDWVRASLGDGVAACASLLQGMHAPPGAVNYFSYPQTRGGLAYLEQNVATGREELLRNISVLLGKLSDQSLRPEDAPRRELAEYASFFGSLSAALSANEQLLERVMS